MELRDEHSVESDLGMLNGDNSDFENNEFGQNSEFMGGSKKILSHNIVIGYGKSKSVIFKAIQKASKKEIAVKEILKKGKTNAQLEDIRDVITMYKIS